MGEVHPINEDLYRIYIHPIHIFSHCSRKLYLNWANFYQNVTFNKANYEKSTQTSHSFEQNSFFVYIELNRQKVLQNGLTISVKWCSIILKETKWNCLLKYWFWGPQKPLRDPIRHALTKTGVYTIGFFWATKLLKILQKGMYGLMLKKVRKICDL